MVIRIQRTVKKITLTACILVLLLLPSGLMAQSKDKPIVRVEPPNWFAGMKNHQLQIMVTGKDIAGYNFSVSYPGVHIQNILKTDNPDYLFVYLNLNDQVKPGNLQLNFSKGKKDNFSYQFLLKEREDYSSHRKGFDESDAIYLLMPDRFSNGDTLNDRLDDMKQAVERSTLFGRQGGDIKGMTNHLDYIADLGFTAIWHTPVFENNQPRYSYHGYGITDFYRIDPRLGNLNDYIAFVDMAHEKGIKVIKDFIFNHIGDGHSWVNNPPAKDWWHQWDVYTQSNFRAPTITDIHASNSDLDLMVKGWFDSMMPDLNQLNPLLADYLIQNTIWWIETTGIDGIRVDTQPYPHKEFISDWAKAVLYEYPNFSIVGEVWINKPSQVSYFQAGKQNHDGYNSHIPSIFDFPLNKAITSAFTEQAGWETGLMRIYETIAEDFLYPNPGKLVLFSDNHDVHRIFSTLNEDPDLLKMVITLLSTTRGIPLFYYGTEIAMPVVDQGHEGLRPAFPGGFPGDTINAFTKEGRNALQQDIWGYMQKMLSARKNSEALKFGRLIHFVPKDNVYVYFRITDIETMMVILNNQSDDYSLDLKRFSEVLAPYSRAENTFTEQTFFLNKALKLPAKSSSVLKLIK